MHSTVSSGSATVSNTSVTLQALREFAGLHHELTEVQPGPIRLPHFPGATPGNSAIFQFLSWQPSQAPRVDVSCTSLPADVRHIMRRRRMLARRWPGCGCPCSSTARSTAPPTQSSPTTGSPPTRSVRRPGASSRAPSCTTLSSAPTGAAAALHRASISCVSWSIARQASTASVLTDMMLADVHEVIER